jgi:hypothetical protein
MTHKKGCTGLPDQLDHLRTLDFQLMMVDLFVEGARKSRAERCKSSNLVNPIQTNRVFNEVTGVVFANVLIRNQMPKSYDRHSE